MRRPIAVLLAPMLLAAPAGATDLALTRVMLSSAGVGYVEYQADVSGAATLGLDLPLGQVDDVLKSIVVFDSQGGVGGLTLPPRDPGADVLADTPLPTEALASPLAYLNALRGTEVTVAGPVAMTGTLLRAEQVAEPNGRDGAVARTRVSLLTDAGLRQFVLEEAASVQVTDPALRARIAQALAALRRDSARAVRHLTMATQGTAARKVRVGYVAGAPLWKATYRLVLPENQAAEAARLQGWAVLENATGNDWKEVEVALQYGNPVTFRQALYRTYFSARPEVPVEVLGRLLPSVDTRAVAVPAPPPPAPAAIPRPAPAPAGAASMAAKSADVAPAPAPVMAAPSEAAAASEGAQETVFVLPAKVSLPAGHTASVPILDRSVKASRIGLLPQGRAHPYAAVRITNDTGTSLPAGVLTLYDPASPALFAGDARLAGLPVGETRLLSFAEDLRTTADWSGDEVESIASMKAAKGVLALEMRRRWTIRVKLVAPVKEARALLLEVPKRPGYVPMADSRPSEETASAWRHAVSLAAGETRTVTLVADLILREEVSLISDEAALVRVMNTRGLPEAAKAALQRLAGLRAAVADRQRELDKLGERIETIEHDEERTRQNIAAVPANDALRGRLVRQLEALENSLDAVRKDVAKAEAAVAAAREQYEKAVAALVI